MQLNADGQLEVEGETFEFVGALPAYFKAHASIPKGNGAVKLELGVPREGREVVLDLSDLAGEVFNVLVFRRAFDDGYETGGGDDGD